MAILSALLTLALSTHPPSAHARATVWVRAGETANGTGWVVDRDRRWVVTAGHVVGKRDTVEVYFLDASPWGAAVDRRHYVADHADLTRRGLTAVGHVIARRDNSDLALVELDRLPRHVPSLPLAAGPPRLGESCESIGHRHDAELLWVLTAGHVRQRGRLPEGYFNAGRRIGGGGPLLFVQSPIEAGESGSAVVNRAAEVIGVVSAAVNVVPDLSLAIDASEVRTLLTDVRKEPTPAGHKLPSREDVPPVLRATVWVRPQATTGRAAGVLIDADRRLVLTSAAAVGTEPVVDAVAPRWEDGRLVPEVDAYDDRLGLRLSGHYVTGLVLARDTARDLAVIELDTLPPDLKAVRLAAGEPRPGDAIGSVGHPTGLDMLWLYASGTVRSVGSVELNRDGEGARSKVRASLLQLPHQGSSSGGPVVNAAGELIGVLAAREAARQELGYATTAAEVRKFVDSCQPKTGADFSRRARLALRYHHYQLALDAFAAAEKIGGPDQTLLSGYCDALLGLGRRTDARAVAEAQVKLERYTEPTALAEFADVLRRTGDFDTARSVADRALAVDARCAAALVVRAQLRNGPDAAADINTALDADAFFGPAYRVRAELRDRSSNEGRRAAVADLGRALEVNSVDMAALRVRAELFRAVGEPKKAVNDWTRLTDLEAFNVDNWIGLARARFASGDRSGAAEALRSVLRVDGAATRRVFGIVRETGRELMTDNPGDKERVAEWYSLALDRLAAWLPN